ncbi:MAG TPA: DNA repair protein RecN [Anaerolineaceae bacterium]|jgi:DNA repair protein RecN (Recombination protein N)|nr:DNA repair protein RecN [Anaerolineaceae bacterium]
MLTELRIDNFAIIQHLELTLGSGLVAFTGETGAGKSIILDAVEAVIGGRADASQIRSGSERSSIEAIFRLPEYSRPEMIALLEAEDLLDDPNEIILGRELRANGRSIARVNGRTVNLSLLRNLGSYLVDIHGQSEHLSLLTVKAHLSLLDRYAETESALSIYRQTYQSVKLVQQELSGLQNQEADIARRVEMLTYQAEEIDAAHLHAGEEDELRLERNRLANAENLAHAAQQALTLLDEGGPEAAAITDLLGQMVQLLHTLERVDPTQSGMLEQAVGLVENAADLARNLRIYLEQIEANPRRLEALEERLSLIHDLKRKYGGGIENILARAVDARQQLELITHSVERIVKLEGKLSALRTQLATQAQTLSTLRQQAAAKLGQAVEVELADLNMAGARFSVDLHMEPDANGIEMEPGQPVHFDENGVDRCEFLIAPNPGEGLKPLVKIASGGETSRLMLALKKVLTDADAVPTLIFDEIDQGIGGRIGMVVGEKLWLLGRQHQVLCVTHLPQLAAYGDQHFCVRKQLAAGRTLTQVEELNDSGRRDELAQMLGNLTAANRSAAQETLAVARQRAVELARQTQGN